MIIAYSDTYGAFTGKTGGSKSSNNARMDISYTGFTVGFKPNQKGYAGTKYNWLIVALDHGEWVGY
jgi:hypothetical protein